MNFKISLYLSVLIVDAASLQAGVSSHNFAHLFGRFDKYLVSYIISGFVSTGLVTLIIQVR